MKEKGQVFGGCKGTERCDAGMGAIALVEENSLIIVVETQPKLYDKVYDLSAALPNCNPLFATSVSLFSIQWEGDSCTWLCK